MYWFDTLIYCSIITTAVLLIVNISITSHNYHFFFVVRTFGILANIKSSVQFSRSVMSDSATPWIAARQASLSITNSQSSLKLMSIHVHRVSDAIQPSSVDPFSSCPQSLPASESFPMSQLFAWGGQSTGVSVQHHSFQRNPRADLLQNGLVGSPCCPRDSQESSPTPQFKSINSSALSFLHSPTLTSIHDHRKNHSLD